MVTADESAPTLFLCSTVDAKGCSIYQHGALGLAASGGSCLLREFVELDALPSDSAFVCFLQVVSCGDQL